MSTGLLEHPVVESTLVSVYTLADPDTLEVRYVGKSVSPSKRYSAHLCAARDGVEGHKNNWIRSLLAVGKKPLLEIVDEVPSDEWEDAEVHWIFYMRLMGYDLTNATDGGAGAPNLAAEPRQRGADGRRGKKRTLEANGLTSASLREHHLAHPETALKMSATQKVRCKDPAVRAQLRLNSLQGPPPPVRIGEASNKAKLTVEKVAWLRREAKAGRTFPDLAADLGVTPQAAWYAGTGKTWKHVEETPADSGPRHKPTDEDVLGRRHSMVTLSDPASRKDH